MKSIKRSGIFLLLLLSCLLLCACSPLPSAQPPADSWISGLPKVRLTGGYITEKDLITVPFANAPFYYQCHMENGVEITQKVEKTCPQQGVLTYGQYAHAVDVIVQNIRADALPLKDQDQGKYQIVYRRSEKMQAVIIRATAVGTRDSTGRYMGYYCYSLQDGTLRQGQQVIDRDAQPPVAFLVVYNDHLEEGLDGGNGGSDAEYIYIFLEE